MTLAGYRLPEVIPARTGTINAAKTIRRFFEILYRFENTPLHTRQYGDIKSFCG
jgi:hypothetical protein